MSAQEPTRAQRSLNEALLIAARKGYAPETRQLLEIGADAKSVAPNGNSALMEAMDSGSAQCALALAPLSDHFHRDRSGLTALMLAATRDQSEIAQALIACYPPDLALKDGRRALHLAASRDCGKTVLALLEVCDPHAVDDQGCTPFLSALQASSYDSALALLPVSDLEATERHGVNAATMIHYSQGFDYKQIDTLKRLIQEEPARRAALAERAALEWIAKRPGLKQNASVRI